MQPINQVSSSQHKQQTPTFVSSAANGTLYLAAAQEYNQLNIVHLYGTPYDFGSVRHSANALQNIIISNLRFRFAHGQLMKADIAKLIPLFFEYIDAEIEHFIGFLPKASAYSLQSIQMPFSVSVQEIVHVLETKGVPAALDLTAELTAPYTPQHFFQATTHQPQFARLTHNDCRSCRVWLTASRAPCRTRHCCRQAHKPTHLYLFTAS